MAKAKKKKTDQEQIEELQAEILERRDHWLDILENGIQDPICEDGANMNLVRNHMRLSKLKLWKFCYDRHIPYPAECYIATVPPVDNYYMADKRSKRAKDFAKYHPTSKQTKAQIKAKYKQEQQALF